MSVTSPTSGARIGQRIHDRYRVVRFLGAGGMGEVYEAEHLQVGKRVAIKCLWPAFSNDREQVERFEREARVASLVPSPHMVDVLDAGALSDGGRFLVMELLEGVTLAAELDAAGSMPVPRACAIGVQLAEGLHAAHAAGIVHRDLKPDNVFLVARGGSEHVKILDFGVSKFRRPDMGVELTRTGTAIGTPTYMSPEQSEGLRDVDARTDVWSLGVILFRMLTGELPFVGESYARLLIKIVTEPAPRLVSLCPDAPAELDAVIARCLAKAPADRFESIHDLGTALLPWAEAAPAMARLAVVRARADGEAPTRMSPPAATPSPMRDSETRRAGRQATLGSVEAPPVNRSDPRASSSLPFDEVVLTDAAGRRKLTAQAFFELPLSERIKHVIARSVVFLNLGVEVDRQAALAKMRVRAAG